MHRFFGSVILPVLEDLRPRRILEVGAAAGTHTRLLAGWARQHGAEVVALDPAPGFAPRALEAELAPALAVVVEPSLDYLARAADFDLVLIDGDHNWFTVRRELALLEARADPFPVVLLHDTGWPYGRRDGYYAPERIPPEHRRDPRRGGLVPGEPGLRDQGGLNAGEMHAAREGGPGNGVLTALEDFLDETTLDLEVAHLPAFHGLSVVAPAPHRERAGFLGRLLRAPGQAALETGLFTDLERIRATFEAELAGASVRPAPGLPRPGPDPVPNPEPAPRSAPPPGLAPGPPGPIEVLVVAYHPEPGMLERLLASLVPERAALGRVRILDNGGDPEAHASLAAVAGTFGDRLRIECLASPEGNVGYGRGMNHLLGLEDLGGRRLAPGPEARILLLNQDVELDPGCLARLADGLATPGAVAAEPRQRPYEHPKLYDPVSGETPWVSGAAVLLDRAAVERVGGFEPRFFMYGEDVDLSFRLRAEGGRLVYVPGATVHHRSYREPGVEKPLLLEHGLFANLVLRLRYGGIGDVLRGAWLWLRELLARGAGARRRMLLVRAMLRALGAAPRFACTRVRGLPPDPHRFHGFEFGVRREGAFLPVTGPPPGAEAPLVSIVVRTRARTWWLREALETLARQTWPRLEVVVVEDGPPVSAPLVEREFASRLQVRYLATGAAVGRAEAGNRGLAAAQGEWLGFLDDDDQLFADHVEVLMAAAARTGARAVYGLALEVRTRLDGTAPLVYREEGWAGTRAGPFARAALWVTNYLPIQAVLFHRSLYLRHGGFDPALEVLEDWDLWTRYSLDSPFVCVEKTTSKYRVPADPREAAARQRRLDEAYAAARARQGTMRFEGTVGQVVAMVAEAGRGEAQAVLRATDPWPLVVRLAWRRLALRLRRLLGALFGGPWSLEP